MIWLLVAVTIVAVAALAALYMRSRPPSSGDTRALPDPPPAEVAAPEAPAREPVFFKRYRPEDERRGEGRGARGE
jgi:hypothetical protein